MTTKEQNEEKQHEVEEIEEKNKKEEEQKQEEEQKKAQKTKYKEEKERRTRRRTRGRTRTRRGRGKKKRKRRRNRSISLPLSPFSCFIMIHISCPYPIFVLHTCNDSSPFPKSTYLPFYIISTPCPLLFFPFSYYTMTHHLPLILLSTFHHDSSPSHNLPFYITS